MSFNDIEAQRSSIEGDGRFEPDVIDQTETSRIVELINQIKFLKREVSKIGTANDNVQLRNDIEQKLIPSIRERCNVIESTFEDDRNANNVQRLSQEVKTRMRKVYREQVISDFKALTQRYDELKSRNKLESILNNRKSYVDNSIAYNADTDTTVLSMNQQQQLLQQQQLPNQQERQRLLDEEELSYQSIIQQQRSDEINTIRNKVGEVNTIFKQLGELVSAQGENVDTIDNNLNKLTDNLKVSNKALNKAEESQKKKNRCTFIILIVLLVLTLLVVLLSS